MSLVQSRHRAPNSPNILQATGFCHSRFEAIKQEFEKNFVDRGEIGASVCVTLEGEVVVDLRGSNWTPDTVTVVFSCTKGATALCAHLLASRGLLNPDLLVSHYWPEFAQNGKADITVAMLLNHQAGLPALRETVPDGGFLDWECMVGMLQRETPFWKPGTRHGYHPMTFGWLVGEVIRRVAGQSVGSLFQNEVAGPLGLDFWIGLPQKASPHIVPVTALPPPKAAREHPLRTAIKTPGSVQSLYYNNTGGFFQRPDWDTPAAYAAELPASGGLTNARSLALLYAPLANGGGALVKPDALSRMSAVASRGMDETLCIPTRFSLGFMKGVDNPLGYLRIPESAFGHSGAGGSLGFADPAAKVSLGYTMNGLGSEALLNARGQSLVDALYRGLRR
jgi:CubicO group peptidase (beta-lactamase class C family)